MLIELTVENFLSYKEKTTFSMLASSDKEKPENLAKKVAGLPKTGTSGNLSRVSVLYGANASGKSNLFKAFEFLENLVLTSHKKQLGDRIRVKPFRLDRACLNQPSCFSITFIYEEIRYQYSVSLDENRIYDESLYHWPKSRAVLVFERTNTNTFQFPASKKQTEKDRLRAEIYEESTLENTAFLSQGAKLKHDIIINVFSWFKNQHNYLPPDFSSPFTAHWCLKDEGFKQAIVNYLQSADISIIALDVVEKPLPESVERILKDMPEEMRQELDLKHLELTTTHQGVDKRGKTFPVKFDMDEESDGTQQFYKLVGIIHRVLRNGYTLLIDEIDLRLHTLLVQKIVELFTRDESNPNNAQLVFTTHNVELLNQDLFRRDQIWIAEKNRETSATDLFSLDEFSDFPVRKDLDLKKAYLQGRFGGIPLLDDSLFSEGCDG
jgi:AAA15 family ATPase/GTPase